MIEHLVFFKFKDADGEAALMRAQDALRGLKAKIPEIVVDLSCGRNFSERARGYQLGLTVRFKDRAGLAAYSTHPEHVAVVEQCIKPYIEDVIAVDYEF